MRAILVLMDSLNRHYLSAYGDARVRTPSIDRLARQGVVFDRHYAGSLPCMPARRELMTGRHAFLETPWGPIEPYDEILPEEMRKQRGVYSHLISDHYHYWQWHGLGYNCFYDTWEFIRGQEGDPWHPQVKDPEAPPFRGKNRRQDWVNRSRMDMERDEEYPTPQCFMQAMDFVDRNHDADNWFLQVEVFDPHEPFVTPSKYREMYGDAWTRDYVFDWPPYAPVDPEKDGPEAVAHVRAEYAATVTMADAWLGRLLEKLDRYDMWKDTAVILTTDHGHMLGEHGYWAKNYMFVYEELSHIPLVVVSPGAGGGRRVGSLTCAIDVMPTIMRLFGAEPSANVRGKSLGRLTEPGGEAGPHHDAALFGYFAREINLTDGRHTYARRPAPGSIVYHHTAMPVNARIPAHDWSKAEAGFFLPRVRMPVYRFPLPARAWRDEPGFDPVYDLEADPWQERPVNAAGAGGELEPRLASKMRELLERHEAPECQLRAMGF